MQSFLLHSSDIRKIGNGSRRSVEVEGMGAIKIGDDNDDRTNYISYVSWKN